MDTGPCAWSYREVKGHVVPCSPTTHSLFKETDVWPDYCICNMLAIRGEKGRGRRTSLTEVCWVMVRTDVVGTGLPHHDSPSVRMPTCWRESVFLVWARFSFLHFNCSCFARAADRAGKWKSAFHLEQLQSRKINWNEHRISGENEGPSLCNAVQ